MMQWSEVLILDGIASGFVGLNELLAHSQEIVLLMGRLLHDVEKGVLHHNLSDVQKLVIQQQPLMVRVISLAVHLLNLIHLRYYTLYL